MVVNQRIQGLRCVQVQSRVVLVVEDNDLLRGLIANAIVSKGFVVHSAADASEAKRLFRAHDPDGVVLDVDLGPGPTGFDLAKIISSEAPGTGIVFLTQLPDSRFASTSVHHLPAGVAYIRKSALSDMEVLFDALDAALRGEGRDTIRHDLESDRPVARLTPKQIEVLRLMAQGKSNAQIAEIRGSSLKSTEDAIRRACVAIGVSNDVQGNSRTAAVARYLTVVGTANTAETNLVESD